MRAPLLLAAVAAIFWPAAGADLCDSPECPGGFTLVGGRSARAMCYRVEWGPLKPAEAEVQCGRYAEGGTLASISGADEHAVVAQLASETHGETDILPTHIGLRKRNGVWANPDGADASYQLTKWNKESNQPDGDGDCAEIMGSDGRYWHKGDTNDIPCGPWAHAYACGVPATCKNPEPECPSGWRMAGARRMCYQAFAGPVVRSAAAAACKGEGGALASVADGAELAAVLGVASDMWKEQMVHIGLRKAESGQWANPDGADAAFALTQWNEGTGEPAGDGDCAAIASWASQVNGVLVWKAGALNDVACDDEDARPYVCGKLAL